MRKSLVDIAKSQPLRARRRKNTIKREDVDLAIEWARGGITLNQVKAAYAQRGLASRSQNIYGRLAVALREAVYAGRLK